MSEEKKQLIGYKPQLEYLDNYESELNNNKVEINQEENNSMQDETVQDLLDDIEEIQSIIGKLPNNIGNKIEEIYDQIKDFVDNELTDKVVDEIPSLEDWTYNDDDNEEEVDWDNLPNGDITIDEFNPDAEWDDEDLFPIDKETHTENEIFEKEYIKNLADVLNDYNTNLKNILSNFWSNFLLASINKDTSEIKMLLDNILLSSSDVIDTAKHLSDNIVRESVVKNMKLEYFSTMFNAEETIKHLQQLKAMQQLRLRYSEIPELIGDTRTNQMNNNILKANKIIYNKKYEITYENLYRYLTSSNKVLEDALQTQIQEMKSKQILIERKGII